MSIISRFKKRLPVVGASPAPAEESSPSPSVNEAARPAMPVSERGDQDAAQFISDVVKAHPITLFMKGSPNQPQCGFSANAAAILLGYGHPIKHVNVLIDPEVRQGIKDFSSWPTIPQIYVGGEFLGGSDILAQMHQAGELGEIIEAAVGASGQ